MELLDMGGFSYNLWCFQIDIDEVHSKKEIATTSYKVYKTLALFALTDDT